MGSGALLWLLRRDVFSQKARLLLLVLCIGFSTFVFALVFSAVSYLRGEIRPRLRELFPERRVLVKPASSEVLFFRMDGKKIGRDAAERLRAMPEVASLYAQMPATFPLSADFQMQTLGIGFATDVIAFGVPQELVAKDIALEVDARRPGQEPIPVLVSEYFLDAYNLGLAESTSFPKLSRNAAMGIEFELILGESTLGLGGTSQGKQRLRARIVGLTPNPLLFGIIVPLDDMIAWNRKFQPAKAEEFAALHIDLRSPEDVDAVEAAVKKEGLLFESQKEALQRYLKIVATVEALLVAALAVVLAVASVGIFTTTAAAIRERRPAWGLHRATGLHPGGIWFLATGHALAAALPSAILAAGAALALGAGLERAIGDQVRELSFLPGNPFHVGPLAVFASFAFAGFLALVPAWLYTVPIVRARPVELLSERSL